MRRIVFDCDRCGKKDIQEMFGLYTTGGESEEHRLSPTERADAVLRTGYLSDDVTNVTYLLVEEFEKIKGWQHYCDKCFQVVTDGIAKMLEEKSAKPRARPRRAARKKPVVAPVPVPETVPTEAAPADKAEPKKAEPEKEAKPKRARRKKAPPVGGGLKL